MWGSLVGISPLDVQISSIGATRIYAPPVPPLASWTTSTISSSLWGTLANIPRITTGSLVAQPWLDNHTSRNYLYSEAHEPALFKGDICKYLTDIGAAPQGQWRMPNAREFGIEALIAQDYYRLDFRDVSTGSFTPLDDGKFDFYNALIPHRSFIRKNVSNTIFPDGLSRNAAGITQNETRYLSGSPVNLPASPSNVLDACYNMYIFGITLTYTSHPAPLGTQGLVRCIKLDGGGSIPINWITPTVDVEEWDVVGTPFGQGDTGGQGTVLY
jgi:hypothetical protein